MKNTILLITLLSYSIVGFGQDNQPVILLEADSTWFKEIIKFPIGFAQDIKFEGVADLRFPPGWSKRDSSEFWSYIWAWSLDDIKELTEKELETNIQLYYDGLLGLNNSKTPKTNALFIKANRSNYIGKVKTFDTRYTNQPMTLNILVESQYCKTENKAILVFRVSPKEFKDDVWTALKTVKPRSDVCEIEY